MLHDLAMLLVGLAVGIAGIGTTWLALVVLTQPRGDAGEHLEPRG